MTENHKAPETPRLDALLERCGGRWPTLKQSVEHPGHYVAFLDMFAGAGAVEGLPRADEGVVPDGWRCEVPRCNWISVSATDAERHHRRFHSTRAPIVWPASRQAVVAGRAPRCAARTIRYTSDAQAAGMVTFCRQHHGCTPCDRFTPCDAVRWRDPTK